MGQVEGRGRREIILSRLHAQYRAPNQFHSTYEAMSVPILDKTPIFCLQLSFIIFAGANSKYFIPIPSGQCLFKVTNDFISQ